MWFAALIPLLSSVFGANGPIGQYLATKAASIQATMELGLQIERDKFALTSLMAQAAVDSERTKLLATSSTFKNFVFLLLSAPIVVTIINPAYGKTIFDSLSIVPVAYMQMYFAIIGVIWGLPVAGGVVTMIMGGLQSAFDARTDRQVTKIQAVGAQQNMNLEQAKAQIFDIMKQTVHLNGYTQGQVDSMNKVIDPLLQKISGGQ